MDKDLNDKEKESQGQEIHQEDQASNETHDNQEVLHAPETTLESSQQEKQTSQDIRQEILNTPLNEQESVNAQSHAVTLQPADEQKKLQHLLALAKDKGVIFALHVAKNMNDPYLLDTFHDLLAKEGYYKSFSR